MSENIETIFQGLKQKLASGKDFTTWEEFTREELEIIDFLLTEAKELTESEDREYWAAKRESLEAYLDKDLRLLWKKKEE